MGALGLRSIHEQEHIARHDLRLNDRSGIGYCDLCDPGEQTNPPPPAGQCFRFQVTVTSPQYRSSP